MNDDLIPPGGFLVMIELCVTLGPLLTTERVLIAAIKAREAWSVVLERVLGAPTTVTARPTSSSSANELVQPKF